MTQPDPMNASEIARGLVEPRVPTPADLAALLADPKYRAGLIETAVKLAAWATPGTVVANEPNMQLAFDVAREAMKAQATELARLQAALDDARAALEPFANCVDQIGDAEDDEEWAKFRLLIKDYRRAATAIRNLR